MEEALEASFFFSVPFTAICLLIGIEAVGLGIKARPNLSFFMLVLCAFRLAAPPSILHALPDSSNVVTVVDDKVRRDVCCSLIHNQNSKPKLANWLVIALHGRWIVFIATSWPQSNPQIVAILVPTFYQPE